MSKVIENPQNLADTIKMLTEWRRAVGHARMDIWQAAGTATEHVSHAYDYASDAGSGGAGDVASSAKAQQLQREFVAIAESLNVIHVALAGALTEVKKSVQAMEDADARRKAARGRLTI